MNEDKKMFDSEHVYNILDKKKCFDSRCEEGFSKKNHKEFCEFLEYLPHGLVLSIIKHAHGIFTPPSKEVIMVLDVCKLYDFMKNYDNITISDEVDVRAEKVYCCFKTSKNVDELSSEINKLFEDEKCVFSAEKNDEEEKVYLNFFNNSQDTKNVHIKRSGVWINNY